MQAALKLTARVQPGHRVEFIAPELTVGDDVEVFVAIPDPKNAFDVHGDVLGVWDYIQSLKPVQRTPEEWAEVDREFREERASWDS